jgi:hypothetical protein
LSSNLVPPKKKKKKKLNKLLGIEGNYLSIIKAVYEKLTVTITFSGERLKVFPLRPELKQGWLLSPL